MVRSSSVIWKGTGRNGGGQLTSESDRILSLPFDFKSRFSLNSANINPEELIAAAHAIDFVMKLSFILGEAGFVAVMLKATANVSFINGSLTGSHLVLNAKIPDITFDIFETCVKEAEITCPVSRALNITVSSEAALDFSGGNNHV
jgi:osmotically inducible protein OsmC